MTPLEGKGGPFAEQIEWLDHRYDPGYFLGGTLRPELRPWLGRRAKRFAALLALALGGAFLGFVLLPLAAGGPWLPDPYFTTTGVLSLLVGRRMWQAAGAPHDGVDGIEEAPRLGRMVGLALMGTVVFLLTSGLALVAAAAGAMVVAGRADMIALVAVLVAAASRYLAEKKG